MDITITLPAELGMRAKEAAARQGSNLEEYVITAVELALEKMSLDEILAPVRRQFIERRRHSVCFSGDSGGDRRRVEPSTFQKAFSRFDS